nr:hypothetical protein [Tanacetum cinerariifolium]
MLEKSMYDSWASHILLFIEDDCDVQAKNIILHGLLLDVYALVNHQEAGKDIWDRVQTLMKGIKFSYQEREYGLYNLFDKFSHVLGETLYEYYWRFSQLIDDMHTIRITVQQVQVNTKFLNALSLEWSKFVTDVKLDKSLYTTNYDQFYAYLSQHERHANEVCISRERYSDSLAFQFTPVYAAPIHHQHHHTPVNPRQHPFSPPPFISHSMTQQSQAKFPQLDSSLAVPMFQQGGDPIECINKALEFLSSIVSRGNRGIATTSKGNAIAGISRVVKCYNFQEEGHTEASQILDEEQLAVLADPAKAVLMANLISCDPEVLSKVPYFNSYPNDMINQDVQEMKSSKKTHVDDFKDNEIHSELETELFKKKDFIEKEAYDKLIKRLKNNRDAHEVYIEKTIEYADTLCGFVKRARTQEPLSAHELLPIVVAPRAVEIVDSPVSMSIDQDAPSSSIPSTQDQEYSPIISQGVEESPKTPLFYDDPLYEFLHEDSTSQGSSYNVRPSHNSFELIGRWTKDHLIVTVIGAENRPSMLEKDMYDSWKSRMELYMLNRPYGRMILESVEQGPLIWPSVEVEGVTMLKKYSKLSAAEAIQADCDVKATNIILQRLPSEVYALVSTHKVAKELWERIQMLMHGNA